MSSPQTRTNDDAQASTFITGGLPIEHTRSGIAPAASDAWNSGPTRRIDCLAPPPLLNAAPKTHHHAKRRLSEDDALPTTSLRAGPARGSLLDDDDDDELVDYFGIGAVGGLAPRYDDAAPPPSPWPVHDCHVRTLPSCYPLDRAAVLVPRGAAPVIAARIAAVLQARSIAAAYDAPRAKADCVSKSQQVEFRIRLYRGRGERYRQDIIVEVQRRAGFELSYMQDVYAILDAAEGKAPQESSSTDQHSRVLCREQYAHLSFVC
jgi:hypothetical protein